MARALMVQGTASHVGKTVLVAALCRHFRDRGLRVAPFKAQNMALNAAVVPGGGEIGWAQVMQAEAAGVEPSVDMNPILLKPQTGGSQVVVHGRMWTTLAPTEYYARRDALWEAVTASYARLAASHDLLVIEGAGSPAEPNFLRTDLVNMAVARLADAPVVLVGDIDRGGVFASLVGTLAILPSRDRRRVRGFLVNRFRGDATLLQPALGYLERRTRRPVLGVLPHLPDLHLPEEDSVGLDERAGRSGRRAPPSAPGADPPVRVAVVRLPHLANAADFTPLEADPAFDLVIATRPGDLAGAAAVLLPGSKDTVADLRWLAAAGWVPALRAHHVRGGIVGGLCGGFQMLGEWVHDPDGLEGGGRVPGLGLLPLETVLEPVKITRRVRARLDGPSPAAFDAYEIHLGRTAPSPGAAAPAGDLQPWFPLAVVSEDGRWRPEGARTGDGRVWGSYLHGLLDTGPVRRVLLLADARPDASPGPAEDFREVREAQYRRLASVLREHVDLAALEGLVGLEPRGRS